MISSDTIFWFFLGLLVFDLILLICLDFFIMILFDFCGFIKDYLFRFMRWLIRLLDFDHQFISLLVY